ncbi:hypothetical protein ACKAV7_001899 [Fusarium commune]
MTYDQPTPTFDGSVLLSRFDALTKSGLVLYDENQRIVEHTDGGLKFHFVLTKALIKKPTLTTPDQQAQSESLLSNGTQLLPGSDIHTNGFEMGESESNTHFLIANKFCFSRPHLMMLTRDGHRRQYEPLNQSDFEAAWGTLATLNDASTGYVVFFNCGKDGGCSRLHKHLQLMPLPANGFAVDFLNSNDAKEPKVPFEWAYHRFEDGIPSTCKTVEVYLHLLQQATEVWKANPKVLDAELKRIWARPRWSLGAGIRIKNSSCPFCHLLLSHFKENFIAAPSTDEVELVWQLGPAKRRAFSAYRARADAWIGFSSRMDPSDHLIPTLRFFVEPWTGPVVDTTRILRWRGVLDIGIYGVDALCLLQNDAEDLELGVNVMGLVYERAWLTVVAACGHDANARLPGIQEGTRDDSYNTFEIVPGVEIGIVMGLDGLLKRSVYDSRAWTFQEQVLSRRVLYFIDNKVFYRCRAAEHAEHFADDLSQTSIGPSAGSLLPEAVLMTDLVFDLCIMLSYYTKRALTNQNDTSRAMAGITRRIAEAMKCNFFQGLPTVMFDRFAIFFQYGSVLPRRASFPSYSWTGWRGCVHMDLHTASAIEASNEWLRDRTWIVWCKRNPSCITNLVWDPDANLSFPLSDMERTMPTEQVSFSQEVPSYPMLQFWTLSLFYRIFDIDVFRATGYLQDSNNRKCGFIWLDGFEETNFLESRGSFEIILLSEAYTHPFVDYDGVQWQDP